MDTSKILWALNAAINYDLSVPEPQKLPDSIVTLLKQAVQELTHN